MGVLHLQFILGSVALKFGIAFVFKIGAVRWGVRLWRLRALPWRWCVLSSGPAFGGGLLAGVEVVERGRAFGVRTLRFGAGVLPLVGHEAGDHGFVGSRLEFQVIVGEFFGPGAGEGFGEPGLYLGGGGAGAAAAEIVGGVE